MTRDAIHTSQYLAGTLVRYHAWPTLRKPTMAEHAWRVTTLYIQLWGLPRAEVLHHCLWHDGGEWMAGDLPYDSKRLIPQLRENINEAERMGLEALGVAPYNLTEQEYGRFKICDLLEMWEFGRTEVRMGNQLAVPIFDSTEKAARRLAADLDFAAELTVSYHLKTITKWMNQWK